MADPLSIGPDYFWKRRRSQEMGQSFGVGRRYTRGRVVAVAPQPAPSPLYLKDIDSLGSFGYANSDSIRNADIRKAGRGKRATGWCDDKIDPKMVFYWLLCAGCVGLLAVRVVAWGRALGIWPVESGFGLGFGFGGWVKGVKWAKWENGWNWEDEVRRVGEMVSIWTGIGRIRWEEWVGWGREFGLEGVWRRYCERTRRGISVPSGWNLDFRAVEMLWERMGWVVEEVKGRVGRILAGVT
ncbi:hypothetical protein CC1G_14330 [Coprinopsis cinerea okayama7|uniref:Uncharacterized protein n=1 Tax=Coprinopsis cinerea (strain Okayama-7 / 130 / ATCC MYA-4618 / FGSC 9003) TaxID=240176 RepID=D6RM65_COPC7|nr:hypothetical protein CC1G_14330 [Coprinopsis cinerea okayama7\|eukprot:XP_002911334.1 hypothetical protein CC1G_14330 [Coprinopsis cinerea okayama7\